VIWKARKMGPAPGVVNSAGPHRLAPVASDRMRKPAHREHTWN
jgi:hypothetical protein